VSLISLLFSVCYKVNSLVIQMVTPNLISANTYSQFLLSFPMNPGRLEPLIVVCLSDGGNLSIRRDAMSSKLGIVSHRHYDMPYRVGSMRCVCCMATTLHESFFLSCRIRIKPRSCSISPCFPILCQNNIAVTMLPRNKIFSV
jgi:hypothetical protein